jgi:vancomycin resistance protein VanJ
MPFALRPFFPRSGGFSSIFIDLHRRRSDTRDVEITLGIEGLAMEGATTAKQRLASVRDRAFAVASMLLPLWLVGQIARDSSWLTGLCFYIPSAFLAMAFLGFGLIYALGKRHRKALLAVAISLPPLGFVGFVENRFFRPRPPAHPGALRLVHWNTGGALSRSGARRVLLAQHADLYVLSEIGASQSVRSFTEALGQPYQASVFGNMAVVGKGTLRPGGWIFNRNRAKVQSVVWEHAGRSATLFVVDLPSDVFVPRAPILEEIINLVERYQPDLIVGDFNAPRRSRALGELPTGYGHAYDTSGSGFGYTWPVPVPMYSLDQCIHASRVTAIRYDLVRSVHSDHCCQVFNFSVPRAGETATVVR